MNWKKELSLSWLILLLEIFVISSGLTLSDLYPFGARNRDLSLPSDIEDISSPEIGLNTTIKFFNREYESIFVSSMDFKNY